ncbi:TonB-dependent receptor [Postechiella marina]|uniref:TonB-dependent receptor n=1 Tax=Postechiella marina TaxID=943941 RepID=A0ABP8C8S2_9FLAO
MKLTTLFLIVSLFQIHANPTYSQDVKVTINLQNVSLEKVFNKIETLTDYKFVYKDNDVNYKKQVSVQANKKPLSEVLNQLFKDANLKYKVSKNQIVLKPNLKTKPKTTKKPQVVSQTKLIVSGTIVDETGMPLPGANIIEKGSVNGATADFDGNYSIKVASKNAILEISYLGYVTQNIPVNGQAKLNATLKEDLAQLDEVVVVGFGSQKKESVVGSITQAKGEELLRTGNVATVSEALTGIMPGVSTMQAAGQPGSTASSILIRGQSTWTGNNPLYVVDGVERSFDDLDPNEIESISVLKDASATAVFGVKAANGVVVVTTKRGKKGETRVNFTSSWGLKEPTMNTDYYKDYATTLEYNNVALMNDRLYNDLTPQSVIDTWRDPNRDRNYYSYTTWINELLKTGTASQYNLNVSGGNNFVTYFTSLGYQHDGDIFDLEEQKDFDPRTYQKKYTWRTNLDFNFSKTTKVKLGLSGNFKNWNGNVITQGTKSGIASGGGDSFTRIWQTPLIGTAPYVNVDGVTYLGTEQGAVVNPNFYRMEQEGQWKRRTSTMYTDFQIIQDLTKNLKISGKLSYNYSQGYNSNIRRNLLYYYPNPEKTGFIQEGDPDAVAEPLRVSAENISGSSSSLYYEGRLNYNKTFAENHDVGLMALVSRRKAQSGTNFPRFEESWVGRATYAYKSKYLAEFNGAYNGNENWAPGLRYGFFPAGAIGWVVSKENFFNTDGVLNFLKFRYSYGEVGSDGGIGNDRFLYQSTYESRSNAFYYGDPLINYGGGNYGIYREGTPAVPNNTWETAIKQDLGIEFGLFDSHLRGTIEFFDEQRKDIIMQRLTVAPWYGNQSPRANIGETKNHGVDIELKWNDKIGKNIDYFVRANISLSESRVIERDDPPSTEPYRQNAGKPIGWQNGLIAHGLHQSWDEVYNSTVSAWDGNLIPGTMDFVDYNGDGILNDFDKVPIKNPTYASKTYAFSTGFSYKNFSMHAMFNGMFDMSKFLADNYLWEYTSAGTTQWQLLNNEQLDAWTPENTDAVHPALRAVSNNHDKQRSTYSVRSSSFLRLRTMEVKYKFGKKLNEAIGLFDSFEVYANGNNLFTWSDLPDEFDPEQRNLQVYPITKRYNLGVRASF